MELLSLFITFFKIGLFTIGGGYAMIPLIKQEVINNNWLTEQQLFDFIGISEATPGPFAVNISTFVGMEVFGIVGSVFATIGVVLPSFIIILFIVRSYHKFINNKYVKYSMVGVRPVVIGSVFSVSASLALSTLILNNTDSSLAYSLDFKAIAIFLIIFIANKKFKLSPILLIALSMVLGIIIFGLIK